MNKRTYTFDVRPFGDEAVRGEISITTADPERGAAVEAILARAAIDVSVALHGTQARSRAGSMSTDKTPRGLL